MRIRGSTAWGLGCGALLSLGIATSVRAQDTTRTRDTTRVGRPTAEQRIPVQKRESRGEVMLPRDTAMGTVRADSIARADSIRADSIARADSIRADSIRADSIARSDTTLLRDTSAVTRDTALMMRDTSIMRDTTMRDTTMIPPDTTLRDTTVIRRDTTLFPRDTTQRDTTLFPTQRDTTMFPRDTAQRDTTLFPRDTTQRDTTLFPRDTVTRDTTMFPRDTTVLPRDTLVTDTVATDTLAVQVDTLASAGEVQLPGQRRTMFGGSGWYMGLAAGANIPTGELDDLQYSSGLAIHVPIGWHRPGNLLGVQLDLGYSQFDGGQMTINTGGATQTFANRNPKVWSAALNATLNFPLNEARTTSFYLVGGGGLYHFSDYGRNSTLSALLGNDVLDPNDEGFESAKTKFGINGGAGLQFGVGPWALFLESRVVNVFADRGDDLTFDEFFGNRSESVRWIPVMLGVTIR